MATVLDRPTLNTQGAPAASGPGGLSTAIFLQNATAFSVPSGTSTPVTTGWAAPTGTGQNVGGSASLTPPTSPPFNTATGVFTAPNPGTYTIKAQLQYVANAAGAAGDAYRVEVVRNGVTATPIARGEVIADATESVVRTVAVDFTCVLAAGDTLTFNAFQTSGSTITLNGAVVGFTNFLSINGG